MNEEMNTTHKRFVWARKESGHTQVTAAKKLGVSQQSIGMFEKAEVLKSKYLAEAAELFGVRYEWLTEGTGEMFRGKDLASVLSEENKNKLLAMTPEEQDLMFGLYEDLQKKFTAKEKEE